MKPDRSSPQQISKRAEPRPGVLAQKSGSKSIEEALHDVSPDHPKGGRLAEAKLALSRPTHQTVPLQSTPESECIAEIAPFSGPDPVGLTRYLRTCSPISLDCFELSRLNEVANLGKAALELWREALIHGREPGKIKLYHHRFMRLFDMVGAARAQLVICEWAKISRGIAGPVEKKKKTQPWGTLLDSVFRTQTEAQERQRDISFAEQHESQIYFERHGCVSCHEDALQQGRPHHACGMCLNCYALIGHRRKAIREGRKQCKRKPPARFGVPSPLGKRAVIPAITA